MPGFWARASRECFRIPHSANHQIFSSVLNTMATRKPAVAHPHGARLLSLDGGGVRGIAALIVLDKIMELVKDRMRLTEWPLPADYFEMAAGTSAGGINAIMFFRLRMTTKEAIEQYKIISKEIFAPTVCGYHVPIWMEGIVNKIKLVFGSTRYSKKRLEKAIDSVMESYGLDANDKAKKGKALLQHPDANKMFMCATVENKMETALLRSYVKTTTYDPHSVNGILQTNQINIRDAVRATTAAPTYFKQKTWNPTRIRGEKLIFWDGGLLNNNPIDQLWDERHDLIAPAATKLPISCVISLGTGHIKLGDSPSLWFKLIGLASSLMSFATNTNAKDMSFHSHWLDLRRRPEYMKTDYIRFSPLMKHGIELSDYRSIPNLEKITKEYLQEESTQKKLKRAVEAICPFEK
ncbi:hypothetical protein BGZ83_005591 [Gryganskiella cystojenkinii]|nr:hypothetical protein BGZ83_005591 [Gryganskiella cystojenkinii]